MAKSRKTRSCLPNKPFGKSLDSQPGAALDGNGLFEAYEAEIAHARQIEQELRRSRQMLQLVLDTIPVRVFWKDRDSRYLGCNMLFAHDAGLDGPADLIGKNDYELHWRDQAEIYRADDRLVMETGRSKLNYEEPQTTNEGELIWLCTSKAPLRDDEGEIIGVLGTYEDITARKRVEQRLRDLARIPEENPHPILRVSAAGELLYANPAGRELLRESGHQGGPLTDEPWLRIARQAFESGEPEKTEIQFEQQFYTLLAVAVPEGDYVNIYGKNVTEEKQAMDALREADRRKDEFLAMLSHELRNPLAPIRNAVHVIHHMCDTGCMQNEQSRRQRGIIDRQVTHMARLLDDLLDVSRITRGKIRLQRERIDLRGVLNAAIDTLRPQIASREQELIYTQSERPLWVDADATRLEQVFCNLLHNASKYSNTGGRIWLETGLPPGIKTVQVILRDEGIGITPEILPRIFDLFTQASQTLDRSQGGLGIGLTLVRKLVEMHGGAIEAASPGPGQGSAFTLSLPLALGALHSDAALVARNPATPVGEASGHTRVLVVDDIPDAVTSLAEVLRIWGYLVSTAADGPEALEKARHFNPEVVILDIGLPGMDGYEVARRMRQEPSLSGARLIAMTGYGTDEDRQRALQAGFNHHLAKPVEMDQLQEILALKPTMFEI